MKKPDAWVYWPVISLMLLASPPARTSPLTLSAYMEQVNANHKGIHSARAFARGSELRSETPDLLFAPYLFGEAGAMADKRETANPSFQGTRTDAVQWQVGLKQRTPLGLSATVGWAQSHTMIHEAPLIAPTDFWVSSPFVEFSFPLWRNLLGAEWRAQRSGLAAADLAGKHAENFRAASLEAEAETAYWRLSLARESMGLQTEILTRAQRLVDWAERRAKLQLGDESDLLQALSVREVRRMDLKSMESDLLSAARGFNAARGLDSERVREVLSPVSAQTLLTMALPERKGPRLDTLAAAQQLAASHAKARTQREELKPSLDFFGSYSWNGRDGSRSSAWNEAQKSRNSYSAVGLRFTSPLFFGTLADGRRGAREQAASAELAWERKKFEEARDWSDLVTRVEQARFRLEHALRIERAQEKKYDNEQRRLLRGRTTTYQTLVFEQDYTQSQLLRLKTEGELLQLISQMKLFRGEE
ncbi:MAG: TolC family protein [Bdellovibrionales bacterium]|nr:TolC family protein [Bdellovibrionales bacterium]